MLKNIGKVIALITVFAVLGGSFTPANAGTFTNNAKGWAGATLEAKKALEALKEAK